MTSFVCSALETNKLRQSLASHIELRVEEDQSFIFRFSDTRVLNCADSILSRHKIAGWKYGIHSWLYPGRDGRLKKIPGADLCIAKTREQYLELTQPVFDEIVEQGTNDAIIDTINDQNSDLLKAKKASEIYALVNRSSDVAKKWEITNFRDLVAFCTTALSTSEFFYNHPEFRKIIESETLEPGKLGENFLSVGDAAWSSVVR